MHCRLICAQDSRARKSEFRDSTKAVVSSAMLERNISAISIRLLLLLTFMLLPTVLTADGVSVRYKEGVSHGFLVLRTSDGKPVADGESTQVARGDHFTSHLWFKFKDGSSYDQTTVFSQRGTFRLLRDHVVQQGPSFKRRMETSIDASKGEVTVRYTDDHNQEKVTTEHLELPTDLANGRLFSRKFPRQPFPMWQPCQSRALSTWKSFHKARNPSPLATTLTGPYSMQSR